MAILSSRQRAERVSESGNGTAEGRLRRVAGWGAVAWRWISFYARNLWYKAAADQLFFLASGITFNVLVTIVPLLLLSISILGTIIESSTAAREQVLAFIQRVIPLDSVRAETLLFNLVEDRGVVCHPQGWWGGTGRSWIGKQTPVPFREAPKGVLLRFDARVLDRRGKVVASASMLTTRSFR